MDTPKEIPPISLEEGLERRRYLRFPRTKLILFETEKSSLKPGLVMDISLGGAKIMTHKALQVGEMIGVSIELEENKPFEVDCRVMWTKSVPEPKGPKGEILHFHGVEFVYLSPSEKEEIAKYLNTLSFVEEESGLFEKRKYFRVNTLLIMKCCPESGEKFEIVAQDLSAGGFRFLSMRPLQVGETLKVEIDLGRSFPLLALPGRVVRVKEIENGKFDGGVEFVDINKEEQQILLRFLQTVVQSK